MTACVTTNHVLVPWLRLRGELSGSGSPIARPTVRGCLSPLGGFEARDVQECPRMSANVGVRMGYGDSPSGDQAGFTPRQRLTAGVGFPVAVLAFLSVVFSGAGSDSARRGWPGGVCRSSRGKPRPR